MDFTPQTTAPTPEPPKGKGFIWAAVIAFVFILGAGGYFLYRYVKPNQYIANAPREIKPQDLKAAINDLGSVLYSQSQDPIQDKLPVTVAQLPNPVDSFYKNPFQ